MIRPRRPARRPSSTRCWAPAASGTRAGSPTPSTPRHRPAGRTSTRTAGSCSTSRPTAASATTWPPSTPTSSRSSRRCGSARRQKYNGLPLADLNILETMTRWRPYLAGTGPPTPTIPDTAEVGIGAAAEIRVSRSSVLAEVTVDTTGAEGVLFKHGGAHGGHVLFIQDGRLHYIYNFLGEEEQQLSSPDAVPLGRHIARCPLSRAPARSRAATPRSARPRSTSTTPRSALAFGREGPSRDVRSGRCQPQRRHATPGRAVSQRVQGAVRRSPAAPSLR